MHVGVQALADELGVSQPSITWHLQRGRTPAQIREHFRRKEELTKELEKTKRKFGADVRAGGGPKPRGPKPKSKGGKKKADAAPAEPGRSVNPTANSPLGRRLRPPNLAGAAKPGGSHPAVQQGSEGAQKSQSQPKTYEQVLSEIAGRRQKREHIDDARARKVSAQADAQELQNAVKRGELIEAARVRLLGTSVVKESVGILERMPGQIQDRLSAESGVPAARCGAIALEEVKRAVDKIREMEDIWRTK
jgi:hypothetical protein